MARLSLLMVLSISAIAACSSDADTPPPHRHDHGTPDLAADMGADGADAPDMPAQMEADLIGPEQAYDLVDPFIGTGGLIFGYAALTPAAQAPLGLVKLGPDTTSNGAHAEQQHMSGYLHRDMHVRGFSHLHFVGTGVADYGNLRVMPTRSLDRVGAVASSWFATQDRTREDASPGFYTTRLVEPDVDVELVALPRVGLHRYTFAASAESAHLAIDFAASVADRGIQAGEVTVTPEGRVTGWLRYRGGYVGRGNPFTLYVAGSVSPPPDRAHVWSEDGMLPDTQTVSSEETVGAVLTYDAAPAQPVELRVGVSVVSSQHAQENLQEASHTTMTFEEARAQVRQLWLDRLGAIRVAGGTAEERVIFYTALYNAFRMPTEFGEEDGSYAGIDGEVHRGFEGGRYLSDLSLWDSFRTTHPLYTLIAPDVQRDALRSLLQMARDGGAVPRWPAALSYTGGMIGSSADVVFGDSATKGLSGIDWAEALDAVLITADGPPPPTAGYSGRAAMDAYLSLGWTPTERTNEAASRTLEFAYHDFGVANLASAAGEEAIAARFQERSRNYTHLWDEDTQFFRARDEAGDIPLMEDPFDPEAKGDRGGLEFTEGSAWHWRFYVPHDPEGLIELFGGDEAFIAALEAFFANSAFGGPRGDAITSPTPIAGTATNPHCTWSFCLARRGRPSASTIGMIRSAPDTMTRPRRGSPAMMTEALYPRGTSSPRWGCTPSREDRTTSSPTRSLSA